MESVRCRVPVKMVAFPYEVLTTLQFSDSEMENHREGQTKAAESGGSQDPSPQDLCSSALTTEGPIDLSPDCLHSSWETKVGPCWVC